MVKHLFFIVLLAITFPSHSDDTDNQQAPNTPAKMLVNNLPGKLSSIADYKGKLIYLDFWASWCGPCRQSFPFLKNIRNKYADQGFEVVAVNVDSELKSALTFLKKHPVDYPVLLDPKGTMASAYSVHGLPTAYIIDRKGAIVYEHLGFKEKDKKWLIALIEQHLENK